MTISDELQVLIDNIDDQDALMEAAIKLLEPYICRIYYDRTRDTEYQGLVAPIIWDTLTHRGICTDSVPSCIRNCRTALGDHNVGAVQIPRKSRHRLAKSDRVVPTNTSLEALSYHQAKPNAREACRQLLDEFDQVDLTPMESAILKCLIRGDSQSDIAKRSKRSTHYISRITKSLRRKLAPIVIDCGHYL